MKFLKKTAALLFCVALAVSVMAVSASAANEVVVSLVLNSAESYTDYDQNNKYEMDANKSITYDIQIALADGQTAEKVVNGVAFKVDTSSFPSGVTVQTVLAKATGSNVVPQNGQGVYTIYDANATSGDDITVTSSAQTIGRITYAVASTVGATAVAEFTPALSEVSVAERDNTTAPIIQNGTVTAEKGVEVNPRYTVTFKDFKSDTTNGTSTPKIYGTKTDENDKTVYDAAAPYTVTYSYSEGGDLNPSSWNKYKTGDGVTAYEFKGWTVTANGATGDTENHGGWKAANETYLLAKPAATEGGSPTNELATATFDGGRVGDIELTAIYEAKIYTVSFEYDKDLNNNSITSTALTDIEYTIEDVADADDDDNPLKTLTEADAPEWLGFSFDKWTMTPTDADEYNKTVWGTLPQNGTSADFTVGDLDDFVGAYGDVTLKAYCKEDGEWATTDYAYANGADRLILYAVESPVSGAVYKCNGSAMFKVPFNKYSGLFSSVTSGTLYAYLAAVTTETVDGQSVVQRPAITIDNNPGQGVTNTDLTTAYNGNVLKDSYIDAGDFGLVNSLLVTKSTTDTNYTAVSIDSRLLMDMASKQSNDANDFTSEKSAIFGSIDDIKAIVAEVGKSVSGT